MATIGVDLGGTKIMAVRVEEGAVADQAKRATPRVGGPDDVLDVIADVVAAVDPEGRSDAIGVGVPGPVPPGTGILPYAVNLPDWTQPVDVAAGLVARTDGRRVIVGNDVNVATLAEFRLGAGRGFDNVLGVFVGTGVGAGLVLDGRLRVGPHGLAGEIGHTFVSFRDLPDGRFGRGELEDYAGRRSLEGRARMLHGEGESTVLVELAGEGRMKSSVWLDALGAGDELTHRLVDDAAEALGAALASAVALVDIEVVVLGGGLADRLGGTFRAEVERRMSARSFAGISVPVRSAALGDSGGAVGAALLVEEGGS